MKKVFILLLSITLTFSMMSCSIFKSTDDSNKKTTESTKKSSKKTSEAKVEVLSEDPADVDYTEFQDVSIDDDFDKVKDTLGQPTKLITEDGEKTYYWEVNDNTNIAIKVDSKNNIISKAQAGLDETYVNITKAQYDQVEIGMTIDEVENIFGCKGRLTYQEKTSDSSGDHVKDYYAFYTSDYNSALFTFTDGKLTSRAQNNLPE